MYLKKMKSDFRLTCKKRSLNEIGLTRWKATWKKYKRSKIGRMEMDNIEHSCVSASLTIMVLFQSPSDAIVWFNLVVKRVADKERKMKTIISDFKAVWCQRTVGSEKISDKKNGHKGFFLVVRIQNNKFQSGTTK